LIGSTKEQSAFLVDVLNLKHLMQKKVKELSGGDKRILSIAIAIIGNP
jgi:ABC-type multidrug transport system ATPase subunit